MVHVTCVSITMTTRMSTDHQSKDFVTGYILCVVDSMIMNFQNSVKPKQFTQIIILCDTCLHSVNKVTQLSFTACM